MFVSRLNELIKEKGITRYKLAKELGVNNQTIAFWANGVNEPKISYLYKLAVYFDVSSDFLLGLENEYN
ncbi:MAG: helix-turn-helix transcriptional regulator [Firmicutes bacterium]|nr:helix-turn-helix transcriptional regulator [Bacillota bacterium]